MNLKIELNVAEDRHGGIYYVGRLEAPVILDCRKGLALLIFTGEDGSEELQIANMDQSKSNFASSGYTNTYGKTKVKLRSRKDKNDNTYFVAKYRSDELLDCSEGVSFMVFTSREGSEEIQIGKDPTNHSRNHQTEAEVEVHCE